MVLARTLSLECLMVTRDWEILCRRPLLASCLAIQIATACSSSTLRHSLECLSLLLSAVQQIGAFSSIVFWCVLHVSAGNANPRAPICFHSLRVCEFGPPALWQDDQVSHCQMTSLTTNRAQTSARQHNDTKHDQDVTVLVQHVRREKL